MLTIRVDMVEIHVKTQVLSIIPITTVDEVLREDDGMAARNVNTHGSHLLRHIFRVSNHPPHTDPEIAQMCVSASKATSTLREGGTSRVMLCACARFLSSVGLESQWRTCRKPSGSDMSMDSVDEMSRSLKAK